jgi:solute carrier family 25 carnitine/acylcarnitine transporter 20/29
MDINNYYMKGCVSGMCGIVLSHPIDSIKTHWQTNNKIPFTYNISNLYRGITSPLIGVGIEKALVFGTYNYCRSSNLSIPISGALSGLVASVVVSPYERIKILRQTNQVISLKMCLSPPFLFKGIGTTFTREVPGFAIYFYTYESLKNYFFTSKNNSINLPSSFLFGGISGTMAWIFIYPQDRIKTIVQNDLKNNQAIYQLIKSIYQKGGIRHFYSGFSFAVGRAILLHSGTFCMMEVLNQKL